jgi:hypothetical protein
MHYFGIPKKFYSAVRRCLFRRSNESSQLEEEIDWGFTSVDNGKRSRRGGRRSELWFLPASVERFLLDFIPRTKRSSKTKSTRRRRGGPRA